MLAVTVVPFLCYLLFRPVKWKHHITLLVAASVGVLAMFSTHLAFMCGVWGAAMNVGGLLQQPWASRSAFASFA